MNEIAIRNQIIKAIKSGFSIKAASILADNETYFSLKSMRKIFIISEMYGAAAVMSFILYKSLHRAEFSSSLDNLMFRNAILEDH